MILYYTSLYYIVSRYIIQLMPYYIILDDSMTILRYTIIYHIRLQCIVICCTLAHIRECHAIIYCLFPLVVMQSFGGVALKPYGPHVRGGLTSMLRMCSRKQLGNDLRRAVPDLIRDESLMLGLHHISD